MAHGVICTVDGGPIVLACNSHVIGAVHDLITLTIRWHSEESKTTTVLDRLSSMVTKSKIHREQKFRFELYEKRGDICHLRFIAMRKREYISPPCKPYKFTSVDQSTIGTELVLLGCNLCDIPNGITVNDPNSCDY